MDGPAALRHTIIDNFIVEGFTFEQVMSDDEALEAFVRRRRSASGMPHARAGWGAWTIQWPWSTPSVQGLRVIDASIFPVVPCANTNFPTLMAAEKIAEAMQ
jgi:5-(hydroxymethyl)furfural/furfural oxidase